VPVVPGRLERPFPERRGLGRHGARHALRARVRRGAPGDLRAPAAAPLRRNRPPREPRPLADRRAGGAGGGRRLRLVRAQPLRPPHDRGTAAWLRGRLPPFVPAASCRGDARGHPRADAARRGLRPRPRVTGLDRSHAWPAGIGPGAREPSWHARSDAAGRRER
jgi:hypothetical protein